MKQLTLIRHAEARMGGPDFDRPLTPRGACDAERMAKHLHQQGFTADVILSSPANRAISTAHAIIKHLDGKIPNVIEVDAIYAASRHTLITLIEALEETYDKAVLVGHNPALSELACTLQHDNLGYMPPCGVLTIDFAVDHWVEVAPLKGRLLRFDKPECL